MPPSTAPQPDAAVLAPSAADAPAVTEIEESTAPAAAQPRPVRGLADLYRDSDPLFDDDFDLEWEITEGGDEGFPDPFENPNRERIARSVWESIEREAAKHLGD